ncbi:hypothetical protein MRX96_054496 [Rhipicephalus microplus]
MGASGSSTSGVFQRSVPTASGSFPQGEKRGTTTPPKPTVSKAVKDSVHKSIAASGSLLGAGANGVCNGGVVGSGGNAISYQRSQWSRNSLLARAKLASAVGRALRCTVAAVTTAWTDDGVEVFFDLGRLGMPKVVRKQCLNCGHLCGAVLFVPRVGPSGKRGAGQVVQEGTRGSFEADPNRSTDTHSRTLFRTSAGSYYQGDGRH